ncbi:DNRLRE domain-containing protein [Streptomyces sp. NBC_01218]|nr:DNRLRE domain-containing protein [Streptomyces sp. NBC_01218]
MDERQATERTFRNLDGTYTTRFYTEPVNYLDQKGDWAEIDTTLVPETSSGVSTMSVDEADWTTAATEAEITLASDANQPALVRMGLSDGVSVGYGVEDAAATAGRADGSEVVYPGVRAGADIELLAGSDSVKETIVLHDANAPAQWRFPLQLEGLTASVPVGGGVAFSDAEGTQRAWMPPGWMEDSNSAPDANQGQISSGVGYTLEGVPGQQVLVVSLDEEWLKDSERVFPVRVDPSLRQVDSTSGTFVESPYNQNFASDTNVKVGTFDGGSHKAAAFLRFSGLESSLKNAWVVGANLALYNTWSYSCTARPVTVHPITSNWAESTTSSYPGPATGAALVSKSFAHGWKPATSETYTCGPKWETMNLGSGGRKLVDDWTHGRKKNYGLAVKASTTDSKGWKQFGSDDYPNGKPSLDVTWTKYGAVYKLGEFVEPVTATTQGVEKVTVTNQGQETWPAGGKYKLRYQIYNSANTDITDTKPIVYTEIPQAVSPGETVTVDAKLPALTPGTYTILWTMTELGVSLFSQAGVPGAAVKISAVNIPPYLTGLAPASGGVTDSLTPTLWAQGKDDDRYPKSALEYTFEVCETAGSDARKNCRSGTRSAQRAWAVPSGWLSWGKTYAWYSYVYDGNATSLRPGASFFSTQVPQPAVTSHLGGAEGSGEIGTRSGNYVTAATDAALATVGPELSVTRTYNSLDPRSANTFGAGWSTRWDMALREEPLTSTVLITRPDGSQVRFGRNANGTYASPSGDTQTLSAETGGWVLRDSSATTYHFVTGGRLASIVDGVGRKQTLSYGSTGLLDVVTDQLSGRFLKFTWSGGRVSQVTTSAETSGTAGLTWTYSYTGNQLTKVCPPTSTTECSLYTYEDGSLYPSMVLDAGPVSYWRLGEREGSVAASEAPSRTGLNDGTHRDVALGQPSALSGTTDLSAGFDGTDSYVELPDGQIDASTFLAVELWFKTTKPGVLVGFQGGKLDEGNPGQWSPLLITTDGKLRGQFEVTGQAVTPMTSTKAVTDDKWHHAVLSGAGTTQSLYLDGAKIGTVTGPINHYDKSNAYLGAGWSSPTWDGLTAGLRYFTGQIDEAAIYHRPLDEATVAAHYAARSALGRMTRSTLPSGRVHATAAYDQASGRLTDYTDDNGGTWKVSAPTYSAGSVSYADAVLASAPEGYWRLGERSGATAATAVDSGVDASYGQGTELGAVGAFADGDNTAVSFDGTNESYVELPGDLPSGTTATTVEMWFRTAKSGVLLGLQNAPLGETPTLWNPILNIGEDGKLRGHLRLAAGGAAQPVISPASVTDNEWHLVVLTGSGSSQTLYLDGVSMGSRSGALTRSGLDYSYLGAGYTSMSWTGTTDGGTYHFSGQIDEPAIYDKSLTAATIAAHYRARTSLVAGDGPHYRGEVTGDAPSAYWRFDETSGTLARSEVTANAGNGTYSATTLGATGIFGTGDGTAAHLAGTGAVRVPSTMLNADTSLAIELWFRTVKASAVLLGIQDAATGQTSTSWRPVLNIDSTGKLRGQFAGPTVAPITSSATVTDNQWHHVVLSGADTTQSLYLDGVKVGSLAGAITNQTGSYTYLGAGYASPSWIGLAGGTYYFTGDLDEAAFYDHPLTDDQVADHYEARERSGLSALAATISLTDPAGKKTTTTYDALRGMRPTRDVDAEGFETTYAYDTGGFVHTVTDANGHATITGHDARGNAVTSTTCRDADSCWTSFSEYYLNTTNELDPRNDKPVAVRDARSTGPQDNRYRTTLTYTAIGQPDTTTLADGRTTDLAYTTGTEPAAGGGTTPPGLIASQTTPGGAVTAYTYFSNGDVAQAKAPSGLITKYTYDGLGRKITETQVSDSVPAGVTTAYAYDKLSRILSETGTPVKNEVTTTTHTTKNSFTYDADGNVLTEKSEDTTGGDPARITSHHYDTHGRNDTTTDAEGSTTLFEHDAFGRLARETDAAGTTYTHSYTDRGLQAETVLKDWTGHPDGGTRDLVLTSSAYDPAGRLASTTDAMGATVAYTYFDDGLPATTTAKSVTQADGTRHDIVIEANTYDGAGNLTRQTVGGGATTTDYQVDATARTTRETLDPTGLNRTTTYTYDDDDRITGQTSAVDSSGKTQKATVDYDVAGNPKKETVTDGLTTHVTTSAFDQRGLVTSSVPPNGNTAGANATDHTTNYRYDTIGQLVETISPPVQVAENGSTPTTSRPATLTGYNTFGEATESRDARGNVTRSTVDRVGRTTSMTLPTYTPAGRSPITAVARTTYDALGQVIATKDPLDRTTRYGYDQLGQLVEQTDPAVATPVAQLGQNTSALSGASLALDGGRVTRSTWTPTGLPLSVTGPTGARTEATYDELGRQLTATTIERYPSLQNLTSRYTWDDADNQTASATPAGGTTYGTFNPAGQPLTITDPADGVTRFTYDRLGRTTETYDPTNRKSVATYDALGNITNATDYGTGTTALRTARSEFDANGSLTAATSAAGSRTTYTLDPLGRTTQQAELVTDTRSITTTFGYDANNNLTRTTDGRGNTTTYSFTPWDLPEATVEPATPTYPNLTDRTFTTLYDAVGQGVTELLPGGVKRERTYDTLGRLIQETGTGAEAPTTTRTFGYDLADRMVSQGTDSPLAQDTYTYNDRGQLLTAQGPSGTSSYAYDADSNLTQRTNGNWTTEYGYDSTGRLDWLWDEITGNDISYEYDAAGRATNERYMTLPAGSTQWTATARRSYDYDSLGRLTGDRLTDATGTNQSTATTYGYDLDDRLTKKTTTGVAGAGENTYGYDRAGRLTSWTRGTTTTGYEWDDAGNRTKAGNTLSTYDARNRLLNDGTTAYTYTSRGTLASTSRPAQATRQLTFDAFERKITDGVESFAYDSLDRVRSSGQTIFTYDGGSNNLASDGTSSYSRTPDGTLLATAKGTTKQWALTDQHTDVTAGLSPDGTTVTSSTTYDPFGQPTATNGTTSALGYQSGWTDPTTGDVNMAARWYQPGTGTFTSRDTLQLNADPSAQANRYLYANADPLNSTDVTGHDAKCICGVGTGMTSYSSVKPFRGAKPKGGNTKGGSFGGSLGKKLLSAINKAAKKVEERFSEAQTSLSGRRNYSSQNRRVQEELRRLEANRTARPHASSGGSSSGQSTSAGGRCTYSCGGTTTAYAARPSAPTITRPLPPQNPNSGPHPAPAPVRPTPKPDWNPGTSSWQPSAGWHIVFSAIDMLNLSGGRGNQYTSDDQASIELLGDLFPGEEVYPDLGFGASGANQNAKRTKNICSRDFASQDPSFYYAPMTRFGPGPDDCRATGAVAHIDSFDLRPWRLDPKWKPAGYYRIPLANRAALHLIANQMGGARDTLRNYVAGYQNPANSPHMRGLENDITGAVKSGQSVTLGVLPIYNGKDPAIPTEIRMYAVGNQGYRLNCVVYNRPTGGYSCSERSSGGALSVP